MRSHPQLLCWTFLLARATCQYQDLPGPDDSPSTPCSVAYEELEAGASSACDTSEVVLQRQVGGVCPLGCQELIDSVAGNCTSGTDAYLVSRSISITYHEAVLYNELTTTTLNPVSPSCNFFYNPTQCDLSVNRLSFSRIGDDFKIGQQWETVGSVCEKSVNADTCSEDCTILLDEVVESCDVPVDATFAPSSGFGSKTHKQIEWEFPTSLQNLGFNPFVLDITGSLSKSCWNYYEMQVAEKTGTEVQISTDKGGSTASFVGRGLTFLGLVTMAVL